jgi:hypothetical protein
MQGRAETPILRRGGSRGETAGKPEIQSSVSEIDGRPPKPSGARDGTPQKTKMPLPKSWPGSSPWTRRLTAKKRCANCREECCKCPYTSGNGETAEASTGKEKVKAEGAKRVLTAKPATAGGQPARGRGARPSRGPEA